MERPAWLRRIHIRLTFVLWYVAVTLPMFAIWEVAQLPLYTIWNEQGVAGSLRAAAHCTLGDAGIALAASFASLALASVVSPLRRVLPLSVLIVAAGLMVTAAFEWASTEWLARWAYSDLMPTLPLLGLGLSPVLQWIFVPTLALLILRRRMGHTLEALRTAADCDHDPRSSSAVRSESIDQHCDRRMVVLWAVLRTAVRTPASPCWRCSGCYGRRWPLPVTGFACTHCPVWARRRRRPSKSSGVTTLPSARHLTRMLRSAQRTAARATRVTKVLAYPRFWRCRLACRFRAWVLPANSRSSLAASANPSRNGTGLLPIPRRCC
ncbi:MAG: hypothetical protein RJA63_662 [Pseudomonadota bacterium]